MSEQDLVRAILGNGYFGSIDRGDPVRAVSHCSADVEMAFDPEDDLSGRQAVLAQLRSGPPSPGASHAILDVIAVRRGETVLAMGTLAAAGVDYRFAVSNDTPNEITHFVTQAIPRPTDPKEETR